MRLKRDPPPRESSLIKKARQSVTDLNNRRDERIMATKTKKEIVQKISQTHGLHPNEVRNVVQSFLDEMTDCLSKGDRLEFRDFGIFEIVERKQKIGRNPKNAAVPIIIPARPAVKFTPGKKMKNMIAKLPVSTVPKAM